MLTSSHNNERGLLVADEITFKYGESELAFAVITQAWKDAEMPVNNYHSTRARCFLCGYPSHYKGSLVFWCSMCGINTEYLMRKAREKWKPYLLRGNGCKNK